ncbi:NACHT domain-containing protein [Streptomyces sp. NPDC054837]
MSGSDLVADFWRPLKDEVEAGGVSRRTLCDLLRLSPSALSELLNGRRAGAPDWEVVRTVVMSYDGPVAYWRRRLTELENQLALVRRKEKRTRREHADGDPEPPGCPVCQDAYERERFAKYEWSPDNEWEPGSLPGAVGVLAGGDGSLRNEVEALCEGVLESVEDMDAFRDQFDDVLKSLLTGLGRKVRRACHPHRVRLLHAAHTVVVIEACVKGPLLELAASYSSFWGFELSRLLEEGVDDGIFTSAPLPVANTPYADHHARVVAHYDQVAGNLVGVAPGTEESLRTAGIYEKRLAELAAECPELFVWTGMQDGPEAVGALGACPNGDARNRLEHLYRELHDQKRGLDGLETLLRALAREVTPGTWPARLSEIYRHELKRPISPVRETADGLAGSRIPRLSQGYVNPAFRTAVHSAESRPHIDAWWNTRPLRQEIQGFLAGHLSGFPTVNRPLIILGDPGSGKSLLTRMLAARLPPTDYLPIRIELRNVTADADVFDQISQALHQATRKDISWETVTASNDGVLPVLIFDGFDELLQAGGADHWSFLDEIAEFQETSAQNGLPVAAIVTSRTVVADQASFPDESVIIRLEPFDAARITRWTDVWNKVNACQGARPLRTDLATRHPELAPQPLLLLMLALYYSVEHDTALDDQATMSRVTLYERLFRLFVRRQIGKQDPNLRPEVLEARIEDELDLLSVIAAGMFNRGRQGVTAEEADHDLAFLRAPDTSVAHPEARLLFGRFFFVHEAKAMYEDGADRRWYEFLHATFGEYLVARKIARTLARCETQGPHDGLLFALLSFAPLTDRTQIIEDLGDVLTSAKPVLRLLPDALYPLPAGVETGYTTGRVAATYRHACYSANLIVLPLALGRIVHLADLLPEGTAPQGFWQQHATLWKSQFSTASWDAFIRTVGTTPVTRNVGRGVRLQDLALRLGADDAPPTASNTSWLAGAGRGSFISASGGLDALRRSRPLYDWDTELLLEPSLPVFEDLENLTAVFVSNSYGQHVSVAHALLSLLICPPAPHEDLENRYETCLQALDLGRMASPPEFLQAISRRLAGESERLPADVVMQVLNRLTRHDLEQGEDYDTTRVSLLVAACRLLARCNRPGTIDLLGTLLGHTSDDEEQLFEQLGRLVAFRSLGKLSLQAAVPTESIVEALFHDLDGRSDGYVSRHLAMLWLLKLAVALDLRAWCDTFAARSLRAVPQEAWGRLLPFEIDYVRESLSDPELRHDLDIRNQGRHP